MMAVVIGAEVVVWCRGDVGVLVGGGGRDVVVWWWWLCDGGSGRGVVLWGGGGGGGDGGGGSATVTDCTLLAISSLALFILGCSPGQSCTR